MNLNGFEWIWSSNFNGFSSHWSTNRHWYAKWVGESLSESPSLRVRWKSFGESGVRSVSFHGEWLRGMATHGEPNPWGFHQ